MWARRTLKKPSPSSENNSFHRLEEVHFAGQNKLLPHERKYAIFSGVGQEIFLEKVPKMPPKELFFERLQGVPLETQKTGIFLFFFSIKMQKITFFSKNGKTA